MIVYGIGLLLSMFFCSIAKKTRKHRNIVALFVALPFGLISGFRWYVGTDFQSYIHAFTSIENGGTYGFEPLVVLVSRVILLIVKDVQGPFLAFALLTSFFFIKTIIQESEIPELSIFLFFTLGYYFSSMNVVRQYVAVAILFWASKYIWEKKWKKFLFFIIVATGFHTSAIIGGLFLLACSVRLNVKYYIGLIGGSAIVSIFAFPLSLQIKSQQGIEESLQP